MLFVTFGITFGGWISNNEVSAQSNNQENDQVLAELIANLTQAQILYQVVIQQSQPLN